MSLRKTLFNLLARKNYTGSNTINFDSLESYFTTTALCPIVDACVYKYVMPIKTAQFKSNDANPKIMNFLNKTPWVGMSASAFWGWVVQQTLHDGKAFVQIVKSGNQIMGLKPLDNSSVTVEIDGYTIAGEKLTLDDMLHFQDGVYIYDKNLFKIGTNSRKQVLKEHINLVLKSNFAIGDILSSSRDSTYLTADAGHFKDETFKTQISNFLKNKTNGTVVLAEKQDFKMLPQKDIDQLLPVLNYLIENICAVYQVPRTLLGFDTVNTKKIDDILRSFERGALKPFSDNLVNEVNLKLNINATIDFASLVQPTQKELAESTGTLLRWGVLTINEAREKFGFQPIEGYDDIIMPASQYGEQSTNKDNAENE